MALVVESTSATAWSNAFTLNISKPSGLAEGDLMIAHVCKDSSPAFSSAPSGWTLEQGNGVDAGAANYGAFYSKIATSADVAASQFQWTPLTSNQTLCAGIIYRISGADGTTPVGSTNGATDDNAVNPQSYSITVTPTIPNSLLIIGLSMSGDARDITAYSIATDDPSWTEAYNPTTTSGSDYTAASAYAVRTETTATGDVTLTGFSAAGDEDSVCQILVVNPEPTNVEVTPAALSVTSSIQTPALTATVAISTTVDITSSVQAPIVSTQTVDWTYESRPSASVWTIEDQI